MQGDAVDANNDNDDEKCKIKAERQIMINATELIKWYVHFMNVYNILVCV